MKAETIWEFVWSKIEEKFGRIAEAFRFFDIDNNTQLTKKEFREGLERLKIKLSYDDQDRMFNFLDINKNGWLSYKEFWGMVEEKRRKIDPFDYTDLNNQNRSLDKSNDQLNIFRKQASYDDYKKSDSNIYRPFFKTNKKMLVNASYDGYGMKTALSDNIRDVISYEYIREIESLQKKKNESLLSLKSCSHKRGKQTKGSRMRNEEIKRKMNELQNPNDDKKFIYKLKQFINVPSSDYIRNITKHQIRKRENEYSENDLKFMRENAENTLK